MLLIDVVPLNLSIETMGGVATTIIQGNTPIPCVKSETFSTAADNQTSVQIVITQGNRAYSKDNRLLGKFELTGIPPAPRGTPRIEVQYSVDANNILTVTASETTSGVTNKLEVENIFNNLSSEDIDRMTKEAEEFAEKDKADREYTETVQAFESYADSVLDAVEKNKASLPEAAASKLRQAAEEAHVFVRRCGPSSDVKLEELKAKFEAFKSETMSAMGAGNAGFGAPGAHGPAPAGSADVEEVS